MRTVAHDGAAPLDQRLKGPTTAGAGVTSWRRPAPGEFYGVSNMTSIGVDKLQVVGVLEALAARGVNLRAVSISPIGWQSNRRLDDEQ